MNLHTTGSLILGIALLVAAEGFGIAKTAEDPSSQGTKRALLIGINRYKNLPSLNGSINDVQTMRQVLTTQWGFPSHHVTMLTDEAATRAGMLAAFERFIKEVGSHDTVYIHYSGHGSQVADLNGDEADDHLDETLVPHDGRTGSVPDITDDELDEIFSHLKARTALIVLDSCHSGTATRSVDIRTRSGPQDMRVDLYRKPGVSTRNVTPLTSSRYILMTGAAAHQEALDGPVDGRYHGFFSYSLSKSLGTSGPSATPRDIFSGIERELKRIQTHFGRSSMPEPQLEAPANLLDKPFLTPSGNPQRNAAPVSSRLPWIEARSLNGDTIELKQGQLLGAEPGSLWALYPPGDTVFAPGKALAVAAVTEVRGTDSLAKLQITAARSLPAPGLSPFYRHLGHSGCPCESLRHRPRSGRPLRMRSPGTRRMPTSWDPKSTRGFSSTSKNTSSTSIPQTGCNSSDRFPWIVRMGSRLGSVVTLRQGLGRPHAGQSRVAITTRCLGRQRAANSCPRRDCGRRYAPSALSRAAGR